AMQGYSPGEQPADPGVIKLNTNESPYPPSPAVQKTLPRLNVATLRLYPDPLCLALRRKIAELHECAPDNVFVSNGADETLALCTRAFVEDDGAIGFFRPSYSLYPVLAQIRGVGARPVELGPAFEWAMPKDYQANLFFMTTPNAPTGIQYPKSAIRAFCAHLRGIVVLDEAYVDFARGHCLDLGLTRANVLVLRTLSKSYALAGLRLGYAVGSRALIEALFKIKDSYNVNRWTQELALAALSDQAYLRDLVKRVKATRERTANGLKRLGFRVFPSQTNFLWVRPAPARAGPPRIKAAELYSRLRERNILVRHFPGDRTQDYLRITIGTDAQMRALLNAAGRIIKAG
ncbi:MAG: histidinol-phosphate transaminase, partial [Lentisphaerae bacterium]|nr:histidinol-phosphate transaminase [Lentisphaerota bacterium]